MILGKKEHGACIVDLPLEYIHEQFLHFISSNKKWRIVGTYKTGKKTIIYIKTGINFRTVGEEIIIQMEKFNGQRTKVGILSKSREKLDFGKNKENVQLIIKFMESLTDKIEIINEKIDEQDLKPIIGERDLKPIKEDDAIYFGGHLKYPLKSGRFFDMGGTTKTGVRGRLAFFDDRMEFKTRKWKIIIPFENILVDNVGFEEKDSGKASIIGGGGVLEYHYRQYLLEWALEEVLYQKKET